jgi:hypothetical protein
MVVAFSFPFKHSIFEAAILSPQLPFSAGNQKNYPGTDVYSTGSRDHAVDLRDYEEGDHCEVKCDLCSHLTTGCRNLIRLGNGLLLSTVLMLALVLL